MQFTQSNINGKLIFKADEGFEMRNTTFRLIAIFGDAQLSFSLFDFAPFGPFPR